MNLITRNYQELIGGRFPVINLDLLMKFYKF